MPHWKRLNEFFFYLSKRLNYVNHARRLADGDWTGADSDGEEDMEKKEEGEREQEDKAEEEGMEIERRKLPKHYANQVSVWRIITQRYHSYSCVKDSTSCTFQLHPSVWPADGAWVSRMTAPFFWHKTFFNKSHSCVCKSLLNSNRLFFYQSLTLEYSVDEDEIQSLLTRFPLLSSCSQSGWWTCRQNWTLTGWWCSVLWGKDLSLLPPR